MSSAIINTQFDTVLDRSCLLKVVGGNTTAEEAAEDADPDGYESLAASLVSMSNHSLRTHRMCYANDSPFANVWDAKLMESYLASMAWAEFFGLEQADKQQQGQSPPEGRDDMGEIATRPL